MSAAALRRRASALSVARLVLICVLVALSVHAAAQGALPSALSANAKVWQGHYSCILGQTELRLSMRLAPDGTVAAVFAFGPTTRTAPP